MVDAHIFQISYQLINTMRYNNEIISSFEKLNFIDKIDVISELIIRYDNKIYFNEKLEVVSFDSELSGYDIVDLIKEYKTISLNNSYYKKIIIIRKGFNGIIVEDLGEILC